MQVLFATAFLSIYLGAWLLVHGAVEFTNLKCIASDKSFADFEYCFLKSVNRSYKYASLKVNLFKIPITEVSVKVSVLKRANGFKPFLYNITLDACKFLKSRNSNPVFKFFLEIIEPYSNMNHTCPYNHDLILEKLPISRIYTMFVNRLPLPEGEYQFDTVWFAYNISRARVQINFVKS